MRILKKWEKITFNDVTGDVEPFRQFRLTEDEYAKVAALKENDVGMISSTDTSEALLLELLAARQMESLLYPELERLDWSGYCVLRADGTFLML